MVSGTLQKREVEQGRIEENTVHKNVSSTSYLQRNVLQAK